MASSPALTKLREMFSDEPNDAARLDQFDLYKTALADSHADTEEGRVWMLPGDKEIRRGMSPARVQENFATLEKSLSPDQLQLLGTQLAEMRGSFNTDIQKDWTPTNPIASGLAPYDLEAPAKFLVPKYTPLRNSTPRVKGQGNARQYKRITGITNSGQSVASVLPFFDSAAQTSTWGGPGNLTLNRPAKISYAGDNQTRSYVELGFSDQVNFKAQFQSLGFENLRGLSHTAVLWAHLMGEERAMLFGRGATGGGYLGIVAAPGGITTGTAATGGTIADGTYYAYVRSVQGASQYSAVSTVASQVLAGTNVNTLTVTVGTPAAGSLGVYELYVGTSTGIANAKFQTQFIGNTTTLTSYDAAGAVIAGTDSSFSANGYDGWYAVQSDSAQTGYFTHQNAAWSTSNPGSELETALTTMWTANGAAPGDIWLTGAGVQSLSDALRQNPSSNGYRTVLVAGDNGITVGGAVNGITNTANGEIVPIRGHRYALPGTALIRSLDLPLQDSEVPYPVCMVNVQDYMAFDWPVIQMSYDVSTYQYGTMIHYAPEWSGLIVGITNG